MAKNKITYIKLTEKINLNDGSIIDKGTSVRLNYKEGPFYNVEICENSNVKKIFWITEQQGKISSTRNQTLTKKEFDEHLKDVQETWFKSDNTQNEKILFTNEIKNDFKLTKKRGRPKKIEIK